MNNSSPLLQTFFTRILMTFVLVSCGYAWRLKVDDGDSKSATRVACQRLLDQAKESTEKGDLNAAVAKTNEAMAYAKKEFGEADALFVSCLRQLASLNSKQGNQAKAIELEKRCLALLRKLHGGNHPDVAQSLGDLGTLYLTLGRYREANDHLQEAFEVASVWIRAQIEVEKGSQINRSWLFSVARNLLYDQYRKQQRRGTISFDDAGSLDAPFDPEASEPPPSSGLQHEELQIAIRECKRRLPESQQQVLNLKFFEGLEYSQIQVIMDRSYQACVKLVFTAKQNMERCLKSKGVVEL